MNSIDETSQILTVFLGRIASPAASGARVRLDSDPNSIEVAAVNSIEHLIDLNIGILSWAIAHVNVSLEASVSGVFEILKSVRVDSSIAHIRLNNDEGGSLLREARESGISCR